MAREDEIKEIAYSIWEQQGCPDGRDCEQWFMAEEIWEKKQKPAGKTKAEPAKASQPAAKSASHRR